MEYDLTVINPKHVDAFKQIVTSDFFTDAATDEMYIFYVLLNAYDEADWPEYGSDLSALAKEFMSD